MINLSNVTKDYGKNEGLRNFSITLDSPGIYCLLGKNGAGKTTFLKLIAGHHNTSAGEVRVGGNLVNMMRMPEQVYFVPSDAEHFNMRIRDLFKTAKELHNRFDLNFAIEIAEKFKLDLNKKYEQTSFGMKVMVNTILGMASNKAIIILDEPVLGFDAITRNSFYDLLQVCNEQKPKIIIVSTHLIDEISKVAEKLLIIDKGELKLYADITDIDEMAYSVTGPVDIVEQVTKGLNIIGKKNVGGFVSQYIFDKPIEDTDTVMISPLGLQDFFISLVEGE
ncbi:ABC transporter [Bacillus cereus]|uniref:ATP-binding cassette domain-containing protein n=1 Tax=Bacillus cereus group TaxID=86661 RepID=UPI000BF42DCC|nr:MULTISPECIES: ABC transporter ATP-binding protein [Bacillus cereus group]PFL58899.1 ABC transporter [Bacillus cereus]PGX85278.1 ABC transporter [Bacillus thuringiensis]HDR8066140.1 ABC transporter ATP-binding protein [Bacillus cereus]